MRLPSDRQLRLGLGALMAMQVLASLGAIVLLGRMSPAIDLVLAANVDRVRAVEGMTDALALSRFPEERTRARDAFERAFVLAGTPNEAAAAAQRTIRDNAAAAFEGDLEAFLETTQALQELGAIHHDAMQSAALEARRLGIAGAWAAAFLGGLGLLTGFVVLQRLRAALIIPLAELLESLRAFKTGDTHRRCVSARVSSDLAPILNSLNELLDQATAAPSVVVPRSAALDRVALLYLLDQRGEPTVVVQADGEMIAANRAALRQLGSSGGEALREAMRRAAAGEAIREIREAEPLGREELWLMVLSS